MTVEPLLPGLCRLEAEIAAAKLEKYKLPGNDKIPAELIQADGENLLWSKTSLIPFGGSKDCLMNGRGPR
jgi:hypothetical protein